MTPPPVPCVATHRAAYVRWRFVALIRADLAHDSFI